MGRNLRLLKSTFSGRNADCLGLFLAISAQFILQMCHSPKSQKIHWNSVCWGFEVIDVDIPKKLITRACYDKHHACAYLQPFSS